MQDAATDDEWAAQVAAARARLAPIFHSPAAGPWASPLRMLGEVNNVGGTNVGIPLSPKVQREVFQVTSKSFTGLIRQLAVGKDPRYISGATGLFFRPGSIEIMGASSEDLIRLLIHAICLRLERYGHRPSIQYVSIDNKVTVGNVGQRIALECLDGNLRGFNVHYDPMIFPGAICTYQDRERVVTMIVFESGSVTALGINDLRKVNDIYLRLAAVARQFPMEAKSGGAHGKSTERAARQRAVSRTGVARGMAARAKAIAIRIQDELERARSDPTGTGPVDATKDAVTAAAIRRIVSASAPTGHKRKFDNDDDDDDDGSGGDDHVGDAYPDDAPVNIEGY